MATGAKGSSNNDFPTDSTRGKKELPVITIKKMTKDSVAIARTPDGDTIWRNTGSRARGGLFYHKAGKGERKYVKHDWID